MTDDEIKALLALSEKATKVFGTALPKSSTSRLRAGLVLGRGNNAAEIYEIESEADAAYLAAIGLTFPALAQEVLGLRAEVQALRDKLAHSHDPRDGANGT